MASIFFPKINSMGRYCFIALGRTLDIIHQTIFHRLNTEIFIIFKNQIKKHAWKSINWISKNPVNSFDVQNYLNILERFQHSTQFHCWEEIILKRHTKHHKITIYMMGKVYSAYLNSAFLLQEYFRTEKLWLYISHCVSSASFKIHKYMVLNVF